MRISLLLFLFLTSCVTVVKKPLTEINLNDDEEMEKFETKVSTPKIEKKEVKVSPSKNTKNKKTKKNKEIKEEVVTVEETKENIAVPFKVNEKYTFNAYFRGMHAAQIIFSVQDYKEVNNEEVFHFKMDLESTGVISKFYYLKMEGNSFAKRENLQSVKQSFVTQENDNLKKSTHLFEKNKILYVSESDGDKKKEDIELKDVVFDPISLIYYLRATDLTKNKVVNVVYEKEIKTIKFEKVLEDVVTYHNKDYDTEVYSIQIGNKKEKPKIWIEKGSLKRVFKIEVPIKLGTVKVDLQ